MMVPLLLLLLFATGHVSSWDVIAHPDLSDEAELGDRYPDWLSFPEVPTDSEEQETHLQTLLAPLDTPDTDPGYEVREPIVQTPLDDDDLDLVLAYLQDESFNKTGQLRYASVPDIEDQLVVSILDVIFGSSVYLRLLNNPRREAMETAVREMLRIPTQEVLKQQLLHKILASRAVYSKYVEPMIEDNQRQKLLDFAQHLLDAHENGTLSTNDTKEFDKKLNNFAFFNRPEDREFREKFDELQKVFGKSMNVTGLKTEQTGNITAVESNNGTSDSVLSTTSVANVTELPDSLPPNSSRGNSSATVFIPDVTVINATDSEEEEIDLDFGDHNITTTSAAPSSTTEPKRITEPFDKTNATTEPAVTRRTLGPNVPRYIPPVYSHPVKSANATSSLSGPVKTAEKREAAVNGTASGKSDPEEARLNSTELANTPEKNAISSDLIDVMSPAPPKTTSEKIEKPEEDEEYMTDKEKEAAEKKKKDDVKSSPGRSIIDDTVEFGVSKKNETTASDSKR
ncbi:unnamed protein product [Caenorhabditis sp. 36 PRJEB53466]|nr:unnamed protein product [Caenorhabditis sp. 36 PRJEB53466]